MTTVVFASSKGGAGKTTAALTFAFVTSRHGTQTTIIDGDPNRPIGRWAERFPGHVPPNLRIVEALGDDKLMDAVDGALTPIVIVDLEGSKNQEVSVGIGRADLVLIPVTGSRLDADEAQTIIRVTKRQELAWRRKIPFRVLFTRSSIIVNRQTRDIISQFREANIPILKATLGERAAYQAPFHIGKSLYELTDKDTSKPGEAIRNAEALAFEIRTVLAEVMQRSADKTEQANV